MTEIPYFDIVSSCAAVGQLAIAVKMATEERRPIRDVGEISSILRTIYVAPDGILPKLKDLEAGKAITNHELEVALAAFREPHFQLAEQVARLNWGNVKDDLNLEIRILEKLHRIADEKMGLRSNVLRFAHSYCAIARKPRNWRQALQQIIQAIEKLNTEIQLADAAVNPHLRAAK
jgi:hypothetical protein